MISLHYIIIIIIIRSRRQQRSVASTQSGHDDEPWTIRHECWLLKGVPSPICWIHEWRGRPGRRRQPGPKREPVLAAATCDNARWAGVWSSSLTTWPNNEFRLLAMISWTQGRLVRSTISVFLTKSCQRIPRIIRWERTWKTTSFRRSSCRSVQGRTVPFISIPQKCC